ncbi:MAG: NUDIX hydrolase [Gemmatimonadaceae bacterium]
MSTPPLSRIDVVRDLVRSHAAADEPERLAVQQTLALLESAADPFARTTHPGHVTGSAIVLDTAGEWVLLAWHAALGRYLQPGGHSEPGDATPLDTAVRETAEETGVRVGAPGTLIHVDVHTILPRGIEGAHQHHDLRFAFIAPADAAPRLPPGGRDAGWVSLNELEAYDVDPSFRRALERAGRSWSLDSYASARQTSGLRTPGIG